MDKIYIVVGYGLCDNPYCDGMYIPKQKYIAFTDKNVADGYANSLRSLGIDAKVVSFDLVCEGGSK